MEWVTLTGRITSSHETPSYAFTLANGIFSWLSQKQEVVAQSTVEVEYIGACSEVNQAIWLQKIVADLGEPLKEAQQQYSVIISQQLQ